MKTKGWHHWDWWVSKIVYISVLGSIVGGFTWAVSSRDCITIGEVGLFLVVGLVALITGAAATGWMESVDDRYKNSRIKNP